MMKKMLAAFFGGMAVVLPAVTHAQVSLGFPSTFVGLGTGSLQNTIANIVRIILGFLGILTVLLILYAGFLWMTSQGNEEQIGKAKGMISAAVIGLVLILAAYSIASFVVNNLSTAVS